MRVVLGFVLAGCTDSSEGDDDTSPPPPEDTDLPTVDDTDVPPPTDTDEPTDPNQAPTLGVTCTGTMNALRFLCTVTVDPPQAVQLTFARTDGLSVVRTVEGPDAIGTHELPLYFMAPEQGYDVDVIATAWPDDGISATVTTGPVPNKVASSLDMTGTSTMGLIGTHNPCDNDAIGVIYDTNTGDLVWYHLLEPGGTFGTNDMMMFTEDMTILGESVGSISEVDLMGEDVVRLPDLADAFGVPVGGLFGNFHHDIMKRNGIYYVIVQEDFGGFDVLDALILFDGYGTELARWHAQEHLAIPPNWGGDFLHANSVYVDEAGDIYLSMLSQAMIAKLDGDLASPTWGDPIWLLDGDGPAGELDGTLFADFSAVGPPDEFEDEHSAASRSDGRLQLLDNNNGRALVITIDEVNSMAIVDAEFATFEDSCSVQGTSRSTQAGNPVVGCLGDTVREYDINTEMLLWQGTVDCMSGPGPGSTRFYPLDGW